MSGTIAAQRFIGQRVPRKEDPRLLTGAGTFVDDVVLPGMLHCAFARSPIARGRIRSIDLELARSVPGVHAILLAADLAALGATLHTFFLTPAELTTPPLACDAVLYVGQPVALVVADDRYAAEDAANLILVDYEEQEPVVSIADAMHGPAIHAGTESNVAAAMGDAEIDDDIAATFAAAAHVVEHSVTHQRISQAPMETRGVVASRQGEEELLVHITCQSPHLVQRWLSLALGLPDLAIRVVAKDVGGSFGLKNHPWIEETAVILAAMQLRRPLKWIEDRIEALTASNQCREQEMTLKAAFDAEGRLLASFGDYSCNNGAFPQGADANIAVHMFMWPAYKLSRYGFHTRGWYTNTQGLAAYRGPWAMESLVRETMLDKAARAIGIDPVEIRRRNLVTRADLPTTSCLGIPVDDISPYECLANLVAAFDVAAFRREQAAARAEGRYLGLGIAAYIEPTAAAGSMAPMTGELAQLRIEPTGKVTATMSTFSQGHGTQTTMAQVIAEQLGVRYEDVTVFEGDSARGGFGPGAAGSRQGVIGGGAALKAGALLAEKVKRVAAHLLNANPDDISIEDGRVTVAGAEEQTRTLREIAEIAYGEPTRLPPGIESGLEAQARYDPPPMTLTSAAHACVVEVDAETGFVRILRWIASEDVGNVINPAVVEGQVAGGLAQAIGTVLLEEAGYDARGNPIAATFKDYLLPAISDVPDFEYVHSSIPANNPGGFRGVGEGGAIVGPPTLVNAIADALSPFGELAVALPLTPDRLLEAIEGRAAPVHGPSRFAATADDATAAAPAPDDVRDVPVDAALLPGGASAAAAAATAPAGIDGAWSMTLATPMGPQAMVGRFATGGDTVSGVLESDQGSQEFAGTIEGARVRFDLKVTKPMAITLKYDFAVDGDALAGTVKMGFFGKAKLTGTRL